MIVRYNIIIMINKIIEISDEIKYVMERIEEHQYEAYIVGGFVRDSLLNLQPKDCDITTSALPTTIISIFADHKCLLMGLKHGTVTVIINNIPIEITTYRIESDYKDHRHPQCISFNTDLKNDLARRDFTINGLAYNPQKGIIDYFNGLTDLKDGIIRCINNPNERFEEDALRIIRALRFSSVYDFRIDNQTSFAIHQNKALLEYVSQERITGEFSLLLMGKNYKKIMCEYQDVVELILDDVDLESMENIKYDLAKLANANDLSIRLAMLFDLILKKRDQIKVVETKKILAKMRYPRNIIKVIVNILQYQQTKMDTKINIKSLMSKIGSEDLGKLIIFKLAKKSITTDQYEGIRKMIQMIIDNEEVYLLKQLDVDGNDISGLAGIKKDQIKVILDSLLNMVISEKIENKKAVLISAAQIMVRDSK